MSVSIGTRRMTGHWRRFFKNQEWTTMFYHELSKSGSEAQLRVSRNRFEFTCYLDLESGARNHCTCGFFAVRTEGHPWCFHLAGSAMHCGRTELLMPLLLSIDP